jgi:hypothetical protein
MTSTTAGNSGTRYVEFTIPSDNSASNPTAVDVAVERVVARLDLGVSSNYDGKLYVPTSTGANSDDQYAEVEIKKYLPINISKESYLFRHKLTGTASAFNQTSEVYVYTYNNLADLYESNWKHTTTSGDKETTTYNWTDAQYVVDPYTIKKNFKYDKSSPSDTTIYSTYYYNTLHAVTSKTTIGNVNFIDVDKNVSWTKENVVKLSLSRTYSTMLDIPALANDGNIQSIGYCLENTTLADYQQKEFSTGIILGGVATIQDKHVFYLYNDGLCDLATLKTKLSDPAVNQDSVNAINEIISPDGGYNKVYFYNYNVYASQDALAKVAALPKSVTEKTTYVLGDDLGGTEVTTAITGYEYDASIQEYSDLGVKVFTADNNGLTLSGDANTDISERHIQFYTFYQYVIKHYENSLSEKYPDAYRMSPMKFAVVRNNVYKMQIAAVSAIGSASPDPTDPDPTDPEKQGPNPDEEEEAYVTMQLQVRYWVVRTQDNGSITLK